MMIYEFNSAEYNMIINKLSQIHVRDSYIDKYIDNYHDERYYKINKSSDDF